MKELELKYGCNPNQKPSRIYMNDGSELPIKVLCGRPGYINFWMLLMDGSWYQNLKRRQVFRPLLLLSTYLLQGQP